MRQGKRRLYLYNGRIALASMLRLVVRGGIELLFVKVELRRDDGSGMLGVPQWDAAAGTSGNSAYHNRKNAAVRTLLQYSSTFSSVQGYSDRYHARAAWRHTAYSAAADWNHSSVACP